MLNGTSPVDVASNRCQLYSVNCLNLFPETDRKKSTELCSETYAWLVDLNLYWWVKGS